MAPGWTLSLFDTKDIVIYKTLGLILHKIKWLIHLMHWRTFLPFFKVDSSFFSLFAFFRRESLRRSTILRIFSLQ